MIKIFFLKKYYFIVYHLTRMFFLENMVINKENKHKRIYHYHIRKTGGTSLNKMFFLLNNTKDDSMNIYSEICNSMNHRAVDSMSRIYVGYNPYFIENEDYFYGFSHIPMHKIKIPTEIFTFTIIRDPVERILSHYKMLLDYEANKNKHPSFNTEKKWIGDSFGDFISRVPSRHLMRQLYMFSNSFNVEEAVENISKCSHVIFFEDFNKGVKSLFDKLELDMPEIIHEKKSAVCFEPKYDELLMLRKLIEKELVFYERVKYIYRHSDLLNNL